MRGLQRYLARLAFRCATRKLDAAIAEARAKHRSVKPLLRAKHDAVHRALAERVWG